MKKNPRLIGDKHVELVYTALSQTLKQKDNDFFPSTVKQTVLFIKSRYPNIISVTSKFETQNPDRSKDLYLHLDNHKTISVNLFSLSKGRRIQPKNPGAKSFFSKYFLSEQLQDMFNEAFEKHYLKFLKDLVELKEESTLITNKKELKRIVKNYFPKFTEEINHYRNKFLYSLRENCFFLMKNFYNERNAGFFHAFNELFMTEDFNVITYYGKNDDDVVVEEFNPGTPQFTDIRLYNSGNDSVGIKFGEVALTLRFKFESSPTSSIKLAVSFANFPNEPEIEHINDITIKKMMVLLDTHQGTSNKNDSNAIGKCHESLTYFYFLKEYPSIAQVDGNKCIGLLNKYYSLVGAETLERLYSSTSTIVPVIKEKLKEKYNTYMVESIDLVPDSYISDALDTGDIKLILRVNDDYITESISLKAISRKSAKITTKNPGIGTILGPTFFNIGDLRSNVQEVKARYLNGELTHMESLEVIATELGTPLERATQEQLRQGIENLFGKAMMAITIYNENVSYCREHNEINGQIKVYTKKPTAIQNTLTWNEDSESVSLRVKFSKGKQHGWSSIKLTSEYKLGSFK